MELKGKYKLQRRLGGGGMAEVFVGTATGARGFARDVAIKRILPAYWSNPEFAQMFVAEAQVSATLSHPNVVSVLDFDSDDYGGLFLVMELVEGVDLHQLSESGLLPTSVIIHVVAEVLRGLGYAHNVKLGGGARGVVHRDVSPHNVLLSWEGAVKVSDFGLAKARSAGAASASEVLKGKPAYMSPEQANSQAIDGRSDLFSVGVMLWELLAGRRLFLADDLRATLASLFFRPIPLPSSFQANVPADLERVAMKLLERELHLRYQTAEAAVTDLLACAGALGGRDELIAVLVERFPQIAPSRDHRVITLDGRRGPQVAKAIASFDGSTAATLVGRKRRSPWLVVLPVGIAAVGLATFALTRQSERDNRMEFRVASGTPGVVSQDDGPDDVPLDLQPVLLGQCKRLLIVERLLSKCPSQSIDYRAAFDHEYHRLVGSFRDARATANTLETGCSSSLRYLEPQVPHCSAGSGDVSKVDAHRELPTSVIGLYAEDAALLSTNSPSCSHLVRFLQSRTSCPEESDVMRSSFKQLLDQYLASYANVHLSEWWRNDARPGGVIDTACGDAEAGYRKLGSASCNPSN